MKTSILLLALTVLYTVSFCQQRKYVDITGNAPTNTIKIGWTNNGEPVFKDLFDGLTSAVYAPTLQNCGYITNDDEKKIIQSDQQWRWKWDTYSRVMDPFYDRLNNIKLNQEETSTGSKFIRLETASHPEGIMLFIARRQSV